MSDREALWQIAAKHTCPDCFHPECLAIGDATKLLVDLIEGRT